MIVRAVPMHIVAMITTVDVIHTDFKIQTSKLNYSFWQFALRSRACIQTVSITRAENGSRQQQSRPTKLDNDAKLADSNRSVDSSGDSERGLMFRGKRTSGAWDWLKTFPAWTTSSPKAPWLDWLSDERSVCSVPAGDCNGGLFAVISRIISP